MIVGTLHQEDITLLNIYASNQGAPKYIKQLLTELKGETDWNTIIIGKLNISSTVLDRLSKQKINKEILLLQDTLYPVEAIDIYRAFFSRTSEYTFFSSAHGTFSKIAHMLGHKTSLNKFTKFKIISSIFFYLKLEISSKKEVKKPTNMWRLNKILLKRQQIENK